MPGDLNPASPKRLDRIFEKCYARVGKRYKTAETLLTMIEAMRAPETPEKGEAGRRPSRRQGSALRAWFWSRP